MTTSIQPLTAILEKQVTLQHQVDALLQRMKKALVSGDTQTITELNTALFELGKEIQQLEVHRQTWLTEKGYATSTLKELLPQLPKRDQATVSELRNRLRKTIQHVQAEQKSTESLIHQSMDWVSQTVQTIADQLQPESNSTSHYGPQKNNGKKSGGTKPQAYGSPLMKNKPTTPSSSKSIIERKA
jgi:chromosome segregation ATPase